MWNNGIKISIFGESHGNGIGVVLDNVPCGQNIDFDKILEFMARRAPGDEKTSTKRKEKDFPEIMSGILNDQTTGAPICAVIRNTDTRSGDYGNISALARPGHADYTGNLRYKGFNDVRGGGHFSGRLTAPLVFAGAVCGQILEQHGIVVGAHISSIKDITDVNFDAVRVSKEDILTVRAKKFPVIDDNVEQKMLNKIEKARLEADSVGGIIECCTIGFPAGVGSPMFDGIENTIASIIFGIPAVKGLEFGAGFSASQLYGSQNNDELYVDEAGTIKTETNHHGGILGGISSGMPITLKVAFKPTPSIGKEQNTIDYRNLSNEKLIIKGRHDPCVVVRAVPVVESGVNIALLSELLNCPNYSF
jgi:chorismate synthase